MGQKSLDFLQPLMPSPEKEKENLKEMEEIEEEGFKNLKRDNVAVFNYDILIS